MRQQKAIVAQYMESAIRANRKLELESLRRSHDDLVQEIEALESRLTYIYIDRLIDTDVDRPDQIPGIITSIRIMDAEVMNSVDRPYVLYVIEVTATGGKTGTEPCGYVY